MLYSPCKMVLIINQFYSFEHLESKISSFDNIIFNQRLYYFELVHSMIAHIYGKSTVKAFRFTKLKVQISTSLYNSLWYKNKALASFLKFSKTLDILSETSKTNIKIQTLYAYLNQLTIEERVQATKIFQFIGGTQKINISESTIFNYFQKILNNQAKSAKKKYSQLKTSQKKQDQSNGKYNQQKDLFLKNINEKSDKITRTMSIIQFLISQQKIKSTSCSVSLQEINQNIGQLISTTGPDSITIKMKNIQSTIQKMSPIQIKYYLLILIKNLRIGMKSNNITKAFYFLDYADFKSHKGSQINPMLAKPLRDHIQLQEFCSKKNQPILADVKYDGQRTIIKFIRISQSKGQISLVSRRLRSQNQFYSELTSKILNELLSIKNLDSITLDGQIVCVSAENQQPLPMQFLITRRRKNNINNQMKDLSSEFIEFEGENHLGADKLIQLKEIVYIFDCLQYNGKELYNQKLLERRNLIPKLHNSFLKKTQGKIFNFPEEFNDIKSYFKQIINRKYEGLILKGVSDKYNLMGSRIHWGKMKKGTRVLNQENQNNSMIDLDLIVMGADYGKGKKSNMLASFLVGTIYQGRIVPVSKVGSGFKDQDLQQINKKFNSLISQKPDKRYDIPKILNVDRWFQPEVVFEVVCQQFTRSPLYNFSFKQGYGGISLRFPVFQRIRQDKNFQQCTNGQQIKQFTKDI